MPDHEIEAGNGISDADLALLPEHLQEELRCYLALKPYLAHCIAMNHDLNNPLAGIIGYCELIMEEPDTPEELRIQLGQILSCALRIHFFVDHLCQEKIELSRTVNLRRLESLYRPLALALEGALDRRGI